MGLHWILASRPMNVKGRPDRCFQMIIVLESISSDQETVLQAKDRERTNGGERKGNVTLGLATLRAQ